MTKTGSTNISRQKKNRQTLQVPVEEQRSGLSSITKRYLWTSRIYYTMNPPARNSRSQTGTPGAGRTQSVAGGHSASVVHTVRRVPSLQVRRACWCGVDFSQEHGQDEVVVILHPARVLHVEPRPCAINATPLTATSSHLKSTTSLTSIGLTSRSFVRL